MADANSSSRISNKKTTPPSLHDSPGYKVKSNCTSLVTLPMSTTGPRVPPRQRSQCEEFVRGTVSRSASEIKSSPSSFVSLFSDPGDFLCALSTRVGIEVGVRLRFSLSLRTLEGFFVQVYSRYFHPVILTLRQATKKYSYGLCPSESYILSNKPGKPLGKSHLSRHSLPSFKRPCKLTQIWSMSLFHSGVKATLLSEGGR